MNVALRFRFCFGLWIVVELFCKYGCGINARFSNVVFHIKKERKKEALFAHQVRHLKVEVDGGMRVRVIKHLTLDE